MLCQTQTLDFSLRAEASNQLYRKNRGGCLLNMQASWAHLRPTSLQERQAWEEP